MRDLLGNEVAVGDTVVIAITGYREMTKATVMKITPKGIKAEWNTGRKFSPVEETFRQPRMFVKVSGGNA